MKIVLQHNRTLHYLRPDKTWARCDSEARTFLHSQRAIDFAHENNLRDVYVTVKFLGGDPDVSVPLPGLFPPNLDVAYAAHAISAQARL
jgi:hypothetical protein